MAVHGWSFVIYTRRTTIKRSSEFQGRGPRLSQLSLQPLDSLQTPLAYVNQTKSFASSEGYHVVFTAAFV